MKENTISTQPTPTPETSVASPNPLEPKKSPILTVFLIVLLVLSLGASIFLGYQNMQLTKEIAELKTAPTPIASISPSPVATTDQTATWKTYTNTDFNFSFEYPDNYGNVGVISGPYTGISKSVTGFSDPATIREGTDAPFDGFNVYVVTDMKASDFNGYINNEIVAIQNSPYGNNQQGVTKYSVTANGVTGYYLDVNQTIRLYYFLSKDNKTVIVFSRSQANTSFNSIFNQILSTFKFTN